MKHRNNSSFRQMHSRRCLNGWKYSGIGHEIKAIWLNFEWADQRDYHNFRMWCQKITRSHCIKSETSILINGYSPVAMISRQTARKFNMSSAWPSPEALVCLPRDKISHPILDIGFIDFIVIRRWDSSDRYVGHRTSCHFGDRPVLIWMSDFALHFEKFMHQVL